MFERINVSNYRGFNDVTVGGLGRINLVAGRNNAGKTALLEAIWLLCGAADPRMAVHSHIVRLDRAPGERPGWMAETYWRPFFHGLDTDGCPTVSGYHASIGNMSLEIEWERSRKTEISRAGGNGTLEKGPYSLKFTYGDSNAGYMEGNVRKTMDQFEFDKKTNYLPFDSTILLPGNGDVRDDAVRLGRLRKQKLGAGLPVPARPGEPAGAAPTVNVLVLPGNGAPGMLETLLCRTFADTAADRCIDDFFRCFEGSEAGARI